MIGKGSNNAILFLAVFTCLVASSIQSSSEIEQQLLFSFSSYCPFEKVSNWSCYWCTHPDTQKLTVTATIYNKTDDSFAYVGYTDTYIQIAVRGTIATSITDWFQDFEFDQVNYEGMKGVGVHLGFYTVFKGLEPELLYAFNQTAALCPNCKEVRVTGHSLGAAVATIIAMEIKSITSLPVRLINFGSPRVGNPAFAKLVTNTLKDATRVVHDADIVPHVPLEAFGFQHIPIEFWERNGGLTQCNGSGEDPNCSDSVVFPSMDDHIHYMGYNLWDGLPDCGGVFEMNPPSVGHFTLS